MTKYQAYPEYKDSGVDWLGGIPDHWRIRRIKEAAYVISGFPFNSSQFHPTEGVPLVRIRDINTKRTEVFFNGYVPNEAKINTGDILIGMDGDFNVSWWSNGEAALNQRVACIRADSNAMAKFFFYLMPFNMKIINELTYFTTVKHLSNVDILKTIFALPSKDEISLIVRFLDHETAKIDSLIEKQQQLIELLKEKRQAVISHAVTKGLNPDAPMKDSGVEWLGEVPKHWLKQKLVNVGDGSRGCFVNGPFGSDLLANELQDDGVPVVYIRDIKPTGYSRKSTVYVTPKKAKQLEVCKLEPSDVIVSKVGDPPGDACVYPFGEPSAIVTQDVIRIRVNTSRFSSMFIAYLLNSDFGRMVVNDISVEGTRKRVSLGDFKATKFVFPPLQEALDIVDYLNGECEKIDSTIAKANRAIALMQERRTALISAAVTGKIDVRNWVAPEAEKAEVSQEATA
ncbi:restriction endonuclease subunit S [Serratia sp. NA_112.1]|uniref:restriction endonuclease subunit S n=1 Tax=Serratia sp. NA_112.1 TaxID=3415665 RepID=UPI004046F3E0